MAAYVIVTAAHNEDANLDRLFGCVRAQTVKPLAWIIVSDGSTDGTDDLARRLAADTPWVRFLRREKPAGEAKRIEKVAPGKVGAIGAAVASCGGLDYDFLAILDADVTVGPTYYERVLQRFGADPALGLAGGMVWNILPDGSPARGGFKNPDAVGGPIQMFRRRCYEDIGGYKPYGHEDGRACADARRRGWTVRSFPDIRADHHVPVIGYASTIASMVPTDFYLGQMHYVMRMPLWFDAIMALRECFQKPFVLAGVSLFAGHVWAMLRFKRKVPREVPFWRNQGEYAGLILSKARRAFVRRKIGG
jgi:glycosyltransferase involved in cell wall biosynthesis